MGTLFQESRATLAPRTEDEWRDVINRLRHITYKHYYWLPLKVRGADLDGLINDALVDTLKSERVRPPGVNLVTFLANVVRSKVSHLMDREKKVVSVEDVSPARLGVPVESPYLVRPEEQEKQEAFRRMCERLRELVDGDEDLCKLVALRLNNPDLKAREIARELGSTADELRNAQKRLSRRAKELWEEWKNVYGR
jgi:DNA-directed RNA polymerase specialized sigma24 family protein